MTAVSTTVPDASFTVTLLDACAQPTTTGSSSVMVMVACEGLMLTPPSVSPGGGARSRKKFFGLPNTMLSATSTRKHSWRRLLLKGPTLWLVIAV